MSSSATIYEEMRRRRPDLARVLSEPLPVDRKGETPKGKAYFYLMPVFNEFEGNLSTIYARDFINGSQRHPNAPRITEQQIEALDLFNELAAAPSFVWTSNCRGTICSSSTTIRSGTHAPLFVTIPRSGGAVTCCGCGSLQQMAGRSLPCSENATATSPGNSPWRHSGARRQGASCSGARMTQPTRPSTSLQSADRPMDRALILAAREPAWIQTNDRATL